MIVTSRDLLIRPGWDVTRNTRFLSELGAESVSNRLLQLISLNVAKLHSQMIAIDYTNNGHRRAKIFWFDGAITIHSKK